MEFIYCYCQNCNRLDTAHRDFASPCERCNSAYSYTPPVAIFVPAYIAGTYVSPSYDTELRRALEQSFDEERDPEPKPASERTMALMRRVKMEQDDVCGICLDRVLQFDDAIATPCCKKHAHVECMEKTLLVIPTCPFCRWSADK